MTDYAATLDACRDIGILIDSLEIDGQWHREPVDGKKRSNRSGAYCLRELVLRTGNRVVVGVAHNWTTGAKAVFDLKSIHTPMSDEDRAAAKRAIDEARKSAKQERKKLAEETAQRAATIWAGLSESGSSDYLQRKKVRAFGLKFSRGSIVVPVRDVAGKLWGLQFIKPDGGKKFLTGTQKKGCFHYVGLAADAGPPEGVKLLIAEGYATAASLHMGLQWPVVVAFDADNLKPVAQALRKKYPNIPIVVCADNDHKTKGNPGITKANAAALAVGGRVVSPVFEDPQEVAT